VLGIFNAVLSSSFPPKLSDLSQISPPPILIMVFRKKSIFHTFYHPRVPHRQYAWNDTDFTRGSAVVTSAPGLQNSMGRLFDQAATTAFGVDMATTFEKIIDLHQIAGFEDDAVDLTMQMRYFDKSFTNMIFKNMGNTRAHCRLYLFRVMDNSAGSDFTNDPVGQWNRLMDLWDTTNAYKATVIGSTPKKVPPFNRMYRIEVDKSFWLDAGGEKYVNVTNLIRRNVNKAMMGFNTESTGAVPVYRGYTWGYILTVHGSIGADTTTPTQISYSPCTVAVVWTWRMQSQLSDHSTVSNATLTNGRDPVLGLADSIIVDETGVVTAFDAA